MYAKSTRPSAKCEVQKERSAKRDVQKFRSAFHLFLKNNVNFTKGNTSVYPNYDRVLEIAGPYL